MTISDDYFTQAIHQGDCLDIMRTMPDSSVDLIFTSPPYANARADTYGGVAPDKYVEWFLPRAAEMKRILRPSGSLIINIKEGSRGGERNVYVLRLILAMREQLGWSWIEEYIWHKTNSAPGKWPTRFRDAWERLLHFAKQPTGIKMRQDAVMVQASFNTRKRMRKLSARDHIRVESQSGSKVGKIRARWAERDLVYPDNVLHGSPEYRGVSHPAAMPEWLAEFFILLFTDAGDVVLDPFAGSGTTLIAAMKKDRRAVGIEAIGKYADLARTRIDKTIGGLFRERA